MEEISDTKKPLLKTTQGEALSKKMVDVGFFSEYIGFKHLGKVIKDGDNEELSEEKLYGCNDEDLYQGYTDGYSQYFEKNKVKYKDDFFSLTQGYTNKLYVIHCILFFFKYVFEMSFPVVLKLLLTWTEEEKPELKEGLLLGGVIAFFVIGKTYLGILADYKVEEINNKTRMSIFCLIINKVSSLAPGAKKYIDIGKISNHYNIDAQKLIFYNIFRPNFIFVPMTILFFLYLIYNEVGVLGLITIGIMGIFEYIQYYLDKRLKHVNRKRLTVTDKRNKKINEVLTGVKIIKFNAWERVMNKIISKMREIEGTQIWKTLMYININQILTQLLPTIMGIVVFVLYERFNEGKVLKIAVVYELITIFNATVNPLRYLLLALFYRSDAKSSAERINELIKIDPIQPLEDSNNLEKGELEIRNGAFNWEDPYYYKLFEGKEMPQETRTNYILNDINISLKKGEFIAVIGKVGAGKSSLLLAMMDEMVRHQGDVRKNGKIAYISQTTFLQNDTIMNNITFGQPFDQEKFDNTLDICQMRPDLDILPGGEKTEIGERGVNLSGGQKQRINIARGVYSNSDIILIDDALSALDSYVGKKVMEEVFLGELKSKTRVMVTHYLHLLEHVDRVLLIENGRVASFDTYDNVKDTEAFINFSRAAAEQENKEKKEAEEKDGENEENTIEKKAEIFKRKKSKNSGDKGSMMKSILTLGDEAPDDREPQVVEVEDNESVDDKAVAGVLVEKEKKKSGDIELNHLVYYLGNAGWTLVVVTAFFFTASVFFKIAGDWWIGKWETSSYDNDTFMAIYYMIGLTTFLFMTLRTVALSYIGKIAGLKIFKKLFWNIMRRPMSFFDTTATGVILNRCTSDVDQIDFYIPLLGSIFLSQVFQYMGSLILTSVIAPIILIPLIIAIVLLGKSLKRYFRTAVEITRIKQITVSPIISLTSEFIEGATIIRIYGKKEDLLKKFQQKFDSYTSAFYIDRIMNIWIRIRIEAVLSMVMILTIFVLVIDKETQITTISGASTSGLIISSLLPLCTTASSLMYPMFRLFKGIVSIERIKEYAKWTVHEKPFFNPKAPENWPSKGEIVSRQLSVRYRKGLPLVLDKINFTIQPKEKVAIIGRTGSGKSTTLLAFMRILEMAKNKLGEPMGYISIDGQRIDEIGLHELRSNIAIIPQDPHLFEGSLKFNVDPTEIYTDQEIVDALESVSVLDTIQKEEIINQKIQIMKKKESKNLKKLTAKKKKEKLKKFKNEEEYVASTVQVQAEEDDEIKRMKHEGITTADKLELKIDQKGENLSIGQRQLICIARALIKKPKILLMDEATANIDQKTDSVIQKLIKESLVETTVVTIAHRLITIIQYDRIIILESGTKIEEGKPKELLENPESFFAKIVKESGDEFFNKMKMAANDMSIDPAALFAE